MNETVLEFGPGRRLMGVLTKPAPDAARQSVAVVITNSGIIHRVGANRLHVRLARLFASHGYPCLRYDLPGIGDSERLGTGASIGDENIAATRAAFDALQKADVAQRFVIIGLCSGADHSFVMTCVEPRVSAAVLIDPTAMFSTKKHRFNLMLLPVRRALRPRALWRLVRGRYRIVRDVRLTVAPEARARSLRRG